ncbi:hypothetical protein I6L44_11320 [Aeromonas sp. FDAARGOS 1414]|nr:hypothetical protein I6L44_11320 [Aeromonas sp. FDAARGOS 1414]
MVKASNKRMTLARRSAVDRALCAGCSLQPARDERVAGEASCRGMVVWGIVNKNVNEITGWTRV